jgi:hypothetical protein
MKLVNIESMLRSTVMQLSSLIVQINRWYQSTIETQSSSVVILEHHSVKSRITHWLIVGYPDIAKLAIELGLADPVL